jgi:methylenetetrahydrofolate reductase (NADPH)
MTITPSEATVPDARCPKSMMFGPCADVGDDGSCEVPVGSGGPGQCTFLTRAPAWSPSFSPATMRQQQQAVEPNVKPLIISELPEFENTSASIRHIARRLHGAVDAVLFGDANWSRVRLPPSYRAMVVQSEGVVAWPGLNARDRNRVALEGELAALADLSVGGVHCVTGNHPFSGDRPDAAPVFDLDSSRLTALATSYGLRTSVAASPHTPPVHLRAKRTADKAWAGASLCMVDQPADAIELGGFIAAVRNHGAGAMSFIPVITTVLSVADFDRWSSYPNARIPHGWEQRIRAAANPADVGRALAAGLALALLAIDGVSGVLLGATAEPSQALETAAALADVSTEVRLRHP